MRLPTKATEVFFQWTSLPGIHPLPSCQPMRSSSPYQILGALVSSAFSFKWYLWQPWPTPGFSPLFGHRDEWAECGATWGRGQAEVFGQMWKDIISECIRSRSHCPLDGNNSFSFKMAWTLSFLILWLIVTHMSGYMTPLHHEWLHPSNVIPVTKCCLSYECARYIERGALRA